MTPYNLAILCVLLDDKTVYETLSSLVTEDTASALTRAAQDGTILESGKVEYENLIRKGVTVTASKPSTLEKKLRKLCRSGNFETAYELALSAKGYAKDNYYVRLVIDIAEGRKTV